MSWCDCASCKEPSGWKQGNREHGEYRDRSIVRGRLVRQFDDMATASDMQVCADAARRKYNNPEVTGQQRRYAIMDAAFCQAWSDKKDPWT